MANSKYKYLIKRGSTWCIEVNNALYGKLRESTGCTDEDQAYLVLTKRLGEIADARLNGTRMPKVGTKEPSMGMTLAEGYAKALSEHWKRDTSTSSTVEHRWKSILKHFDTKKPLKSISRADLVTLVGHLLAEGDAKGTVNRKLSVISTILTLAVDKWEILDATPKVPTLKEPVGVRLPMSQDDYDKALVYLAEGRGKWDADVSAFIQLSWGCGARLSEVIKLEHSHYDLNKGTISLWDTKNNSYRVLPITQRIKSLLANRSGFGRPFEMLNKDKVDHAWARCREACNISTRVCVHSIRHTVISKLIDADVNILKVMQFAGHKRIETTKRYTHLASNALTECRDVLE